MAVLPFILINAAVLGPQFAHRILSLEVHVVMYNTIDLHAHENDVQLFFSLQFSNSMDTLLG